MAHPHFTDGPADLFCSAPDSDRATVEARSKGSGCDRSSSGRMPRTSSTASSGSWIALVPGHGRRHALRLLEE